MGNYTSLGVVVIQGPTVEMLGFRPGYRVLLECGIYPIFFDETEPVEQGPWGD